jgi:hypothetical protein
MTDGHATHAGVLLLQALEIFRRTGAAEAADVCSELDVAAKAESHVPAVTGPPCRRRADHACASTDSAAAANPAPLELTLRQGWPAKQVHLSSGQTARATPESAHMYPSTGMSSLSPANTYSAISNVSRTAGVAQFPGGL